MNISILYYDKTMKPEQIQNLVNQVRVALGEESRLIVLPKDFDLMLSCSADQLLQVRALIDSAINLQIQQGAVALPTVPEVLYDDMDEDEEEQEPKGKIIDITKYLS